MNISLERAEILKATQGISTFDRGQAEPKKSSDKKMIFEAMIPGLVDFVQQTAKCLEYYKTHASHEHGAGGEGRVGKVILCGSGANLKGLDEFVSLKLNTPVIVGDFRKSVDPEVLKSNAFWGDKISGNFDVAAGLALRALKEEHIDD